MEGTGETALFVKAVWSVFLVLGLAIVAERANTRIAGIISGAPLSILLIYVFVGIELGTAHIVESIPHSIAAFTATLAFVLGYYWASVRLRAFASVGSAAVGLAAYLAVAAVLVQFDFSLAGALVLTVATLLMGSWKLRRVPVMPVERAVRYTPKLIVLRGISAAALVVAVILVAEATGPRWTGLMTGFPSTILPTLLILHSTYGPAPPQALLRNFPLAMGSILIFVLCVRLAYPTVGVLPGTALALVPAMLYLGALAVWPGTRATSR
ncbi:MAG: hypothetical protein AAF409_07935 [Pseudomonadota bacterium]